MKARRSRCVPKRIQGIIYNAQCLLDERSQWGLGGGKVVHLLRDCTLVNGLHGGRWKLHSRSSGSCERLREDAMRGTRLETQRL